MGNERYKRKGQLFGIPGEGALKDHIRLSTTIYIFQVQEAARTTEKFRNAKFIRKRYFNSQNNAKKTLPMRTMIEWNNHYCTL